MRYFPIFVDLKDRPVVVVGGGEEALRKVRLLLKTDARIGVIAAELHDELESLADLGRIEWIARVFVPMLLDDAALVYSADANLNHAVSAAARQRGIPVNAVDDAALSTFIVPAIVDRDPVVVAIGTEGTAPVLAQGIRARIEQLLPAALGRLAKAAEALRPKVAATVPAGNRRRGFWQRFFFGSIREAFLAGNSDVYENELNQALSHESAPAIGRISLVAAGPGDPELLTLQAHRKLQEADVIVYDRLIDPGILEFARRDAVRIPVGKTPYEIDRFLIREAKSGKHVVRLKAGCPDVRGHGGDIIPFPVREDIREAALRAAS
jgi:uroporphyrin-III C-methyltransferase / precorrin-2 dehydrogenase / sirohydrochlorin ferrochelatase